MTKEANAKKDRAILHVDMDGFYAAVVSLSHPEVEGKPLLVYLRYPNDAIVALIQLQGAK